jgi:predicted metal-dependent phosphoesterase TrpH
MKTRIPLLILAAACMTVSFDAGAQNAAVRPLNLSLPMLPPSLVTYQPALPTVSPLTPSAITAPVSLAPASAVAPQAAAPSAKASLTVAAAAVAIAPTRSNDDPIAGVLESRQIFDAAAGKTNDAIDLNNLEPLIKYDPKTWTSAVSFHAHSRYSDGEFTPTEVAQKMHAAGLQDVALTDHDNVQGVAEFVAAAKALGMRPHTGIELTGGPGIHIVVLDLDIHESRLTAMLQRIAQWRLVRAKAYVAYLNQHPDFKAKGVTITIEEVLAKTMNGQIERPDIAAVLVDKGMVADKAEAFTKYIGFEIKTPEVLKLQPKPEESIATARAAGGIAFIAHPYTIGKDGRTAEELVDMGIQGVEVYRPNKAASDENLEELKRMQMKRYLTVAHDMGLLVLPGADFHGPSMPALNDVTSPMPKVLAAQLLEALRPHRVKALAVLARRLAEAATSALAAHL